MDVTYNQEEETLDPENWEELRKLGHQMINDMLDYLQDVRKRPLWQKIPNETKKILKTPVPHDPTDVTQVYAQFKEHILPYPMGNIHPGFWGWVIGTGDGLGALAEFLASIMNPNLGGGEHAANYIERQVINWFKELFNFPISASGLLVSGGSMANVIGLTVARNQKGGFKIREQGLYSEKQLIFYSSTETHSSNIKAIDLLGIGQKNLRLIPVNQNFEINTSLLVDQIEKDLADGYKPICIIGNVGTVNTGAIDDINTLASICQKYDLWFHIDGAFGSLVFFSEKLKSLVKGINKADSLAFDLHKWLHTPYEAGAILIKDDGHHYQSFTYVPDYLSHSTRGIHGASHWFSDYGIELSRGFKALKIWMCIKTFGIKKYGRLIHQNIQQANFLEKLISQEEKLELMASVALNIVCYRFNPSLTDDKKLNQLNEEILIQLHERGKVAPSYTRLNGKYVIRAAITNHRTTISDIELLVRQTIEIGNSLI